MKEAQKKISTQIGELYLVASQKGLRGVFWEEQEAEVALESSCERAILDQAELQLNEYLSGDRKTFDLALDQQGTDFQKRVWKQLSKIPYGVTKSYKDIASELQDSNASRAVGTANGKNPLCIIVPCHRVIAADGSLGGYSGGLDLKKRLLELERAL